MLNLHVETSQLIYTENWFRGFTWWQQWALMRQHWETQWPNFVLINKQFLIRLHLHWQATVLMNCNALLFCKVFRFGKPKTKQVWIVLMLIVYVFVCVNLDVFSSFHHAFHAWTNITRDQVRDIKISKWCCLVESFLQACDYAKKMQTVPR